MSIMKIDGMIKKFVISIVLYILRISKKSILTIPVLFFILSLFLFISSVFYTSSVIPDIIILILLIEILGIYVLESMMNEKQYYKILNYIDKLENKLYIYLGGKYWKEGKHDK